MMNIFVRYTWLPLAALLAFAGTGCEVSVGSGDGLDDYDGDDWSVDEGQQDGAGSDDSDAGVTGADDDDDDDLETDADVSDPDGQDTPTAGGDGSDDVSDPADAVELDDLATAVARALCAAQEACVGTERLQARLLGADCVEQVAIGLSEGTLSQVQAAVTSGALEYDANAMAACLSDLSDLRCAVNVSRIGDLCADALRGAAEQGSPCASHFECTGNTFCDYGSDELVCPGVCQPRSAAGEPCVNGDDEMCEVGLLCVAGSCNAPVETGDCGIDGPVCVLDHECVPRAKDDGDGNWCRPVDSVYAGVQDDDCSPSTTLCADGLVCDRGSLTCVPASESGEACTPLSLPEPCPGNEYCDPESNVCTARVAAGGECDASLAKQCAVGHLCVDNVCAKLGLNGDACEVDGDCYSENCNLVTGACESALMCL